MKMKHIALALSLLALAACSGTSDAAFEGNWEFVSGEVDGVAISPVNSHPITMVVDAESMTGSAGCNNYMAGYELNGTGITVSPGASTMMACEPAAVMEAESAFVGALENLDAMRIEGTTLTLTGPGVSLTFEP